MKKILSLVLVLMLALSACAFGESTTTDAGIVLSEIELNLGEAVVLNPTLNMAIGAEGDTAWLELGTTINGESVLVAECEIGNDELFVSLDGANDVWHIAGADALLDSNDVGYTTADLIAMIAGLLPQMTQETIEAGIAMIAAYGVTVETLGDMDYRISYEEEGISVSARLTVALNAAKPFDFSAKNAVEITDDMTELPDSDVVTVAMNGFTALMADESVAALVSVVEALTGESLGIATGTDAA